MISCGGAWSSEADGTDGLSKGEVFGDDCLTSAVDNIARQVSGDRWTHKVFEQVRIATASANVICRPF